MIEIRRLTKSFGRVKALKNIDLTFEAGKVSAIIGPNGSGKTTLIKCILGLVSPDQGIIAVNGALLDGDCDYRRQIGYLPQIAKLPENLSAREILTMVEDLRGEKSNNLKDLIQLFCLNGDLGKKARELSGGTRQKLCAILALMFDPPILILDEPTAGLDPVSSGRLKDLIMEEKGRGKAIIMTSHILSEVQELADNLAFLLEGSLKFSGDIDAVLVRTGEPRLERAIARMMENSLP